MYICISQSFLKYNYLDETERQKMDALQLPNFAARDNQAPLFATLDTQRGPRFYWVSGVITVHLQHFMRLI